MKKNAMQKIFFWVCIFVFSGCGGFTEDWFQGSCSDSALPGLASPDPYDAACLVQFGTMSEDSVNDSLVMQLQTLGGCLPNGGSEKWGTDFRFADTVRAAYSFKGDTLSLSFKSGEENVTIMMVDGPLGKLYGIWTLTPCAYIDDERVCLEDGYDRFVRFGESLAEYRVNVKK